METLRVLLKLENKMEKRGKRTEKMGRANRRHGGGTADWFRAAENDKKTPSKHNLLDIPYSKS
jgi:hypothetical protein